MDWIQAESTRFKSALANANDNKVVSQKKSCLAQSQFCHYQHIKLLKFLCLQSRQSTMILFFCISLDGFNERKLACAWMCVCFFVLICHDRQTQFHALLSKNVALAGLSATERNMFLSSLLYEHLRLDLRQKEREKIKQSLK